MKKIGIYEVMNSVIYFYLCLNLGMYKYWILEFGIMWLNKFKIKIWCMFLLI